MFNLYPNQQTAHDSVISHLSSHSNALMVMATGLGKTVVSAFLTKTLIETMGFKRILFLCHENEILKQSRNTYQNILGKQFSYGYFCGLGQNYSNPNCLFGSFGTMVNRLEQFSVSHFDLVIVDEAHHSQAPTHRQVLDYFQPKKRFAMTATPDRMDGFDIRELFGNEVVNYPLPIALRNGWLVPFKYRIMTNEIDGAVIQGMLGEVQKGKRFTIQDINKKLFIQKRNEEIAGIINADPAKTITFCPSTDACGEFEGLLDSSVAYHSKIPNDVNERSLRRFRENGLRNIITVNKFNEGTDVPDAVRAIFLRSTLSDTVFYQQLGRILRKCEGKEYAEVLDFIGNIQRIKEIADLAGITSKSRPKKPNTPEKPDVDGPGEPPEIIHISGEGFDFEFQEEVFDILEILEKSEFFTLEEAIEHAKGRFIGREDYVQRCKSVNPRFHSMPEVYYSDFPGYDFYLGIRFTLEEAMEFIKGKFTGRSDYCKRCTSVDYRLHSTPHTYYPNFPGWDKYLDLYFSTWQEASECMQVRIRTTREYAKKSLRVSISPKLHPSPQDYYKDFPGWLTYFGYFSTWQEASEFAQGKFSGYQDYVARFRLVDNRFHGSPHTVYPNFPGWGVYLSLGKGLSSIQNRLKHIKTKEDYFTLEEAMKLVRGSFTGQSHYRTKCKDIDDRFHTNPDEYYPDFPGWDVYLGNDRVL